MARPRVGSKATQARDGKQCGAGNHSANAPRRDANPRNRGVLKVGSRKGRAVARTRKRWLPLRTICLAIVGASMAASIAVAPQLSLQASRREVATGMGQQFREHHLHYAVATAGTEDTVLRIEAPSMTRSFAQFLVRDPAKAERLGKLGFTAIVFANEQGATWTYEIEQGRFN
jgi:hypothetical protein